MSQHVIISIIISLIILVDETVLILNSELTSVIKTPISDQDRVSLYDIHWISSRQTIRIRRGIN